MVVVIVRVDEPDPLDTRITLVGLREVVGWPGTVHGSLGGEHWEALAVTVVFRLIVPEKNWRDVVVALDEGDEPDDELVNCETKFTGLMFDRVTVVVVDEPLGIVRLLAFAMRLKS